ncbi:MAG: hypothetical protein J0665_12045 [Deltaproteobacteria bacterium]|nr:hypothetical protein [Deltaproteobacteria bacterium]
MSIENALKKMLEDKGFMPKKTKIGSVWTYDHIKYMPVNFHENGYISFNYLAKYMRDEVKNTHGTIIGISKSEKEQLYRKALSLLGFYESIKNKIKFSLREKGSDYVPISEEVGIDILSKILQFITVDCGEEKQFCQSEIAEEYLPDWPCVKSAIDQISHDAPTIDEILDQIEQKTRADKKVLKQNWREITRNTIPIWLTAQPK